MTDREKLVELLNEADGFIAALAPMTRTGELRQQLENLTGEVYSELPRQFCPMCGRKLT